MELTTPPERYWHCLVKVEGEERYSVLNDLTFSELQRTVVQPWLASRPFTIAGKLIRSSEKVERIRIVHTPEPQTFYAQRHDAEMHASGIADLVTDRRALPFSKGEDVTNAMLFEGVPEPKPEAELALVERVCQRLPQAARILAIRSRKGKASFEISDEYDVQDFLHAVLRAYLKYSVQEDPLPKTAGTKAGRADVSIEELGILIEVKFVRGPDDQRRIFEEFSQDLVLYAQWKPLRTLIVLIYNSGDLRDAEAMDKLGGVQEVNAKRFDVKIILA